MGKILFTKILCKKKKKKKKVMHNQKRKKSYAQGQSTSIRPFGIHLGNRLLTNREV